MQKLIETFSQGTHNILNNEIIPADAASKSVNWQTTDGVIELIRGREVFGTLGGPGSIQELHTGFKANGDSVFFRKMADKIQAYVSDTWTDVITGLSETEPVKFANYQSISGTYVYIFSREGLWKICTANPTDYADQYVSTKNFKGYGIIDNARTLLWGRAEDQTGLYGSYIDAQDSDVYTLVENEATTSLSGTLAFKAGGARRTCFGIQLTITGSGEVYTDDFNGNLTGNMGGTGTINYMTGAYTVSNAGVGTVDYQWEDATNKGVLDFSKSGTRLAGQGFTLRQDLNGDPIQNILILEGQYFSIKKTSTYRYIADIADVNPTNEIFRTDIGMPSLNAAISTGQGIVFVNTANPDKPKLTILERNPLGDDVVSRELAGHFDFSKYDYKNARTITHNRFVLISCSENSMVNNRVLLVDVQAGTVDVLNYGVESFTKDKGVLYAGDPSSQTVYKFFTGYDDDNYPIENSWESRGERYDTGDLKRFKKLRLKGKIYGDQIMEVYISYDDGGYQLVGTIRGDGDYVDITQPDYVGYTMVGEEAIGGNSTQVVYPYFMEMKIKSGKFRKRMIKFVAKSIGYVSVSHLNDYDIWLYENKLPKKYRLKQKVSKDGTSTNL